MQRFCVCVSEEFVGIYTNFNSQDTVALSPTFVSQWESDKCHSSLW